MLLSGLSASPQQDGGDIGATVIVHLTAGVSAQCEFMVTSAARPAEISIVCMYVRIYIYMVSMIQTL